jgi:hypothetical protein
MVHSARLLDSKNLLVMRYRHKWTRGLECTVTKLPTKTDKVYTAEIVEGNPFRVNKEIFENEWIKL